MRRAYSRNIIRSIYMSLGRYFAILAIIALGVGFFSGLKATKPAMMVTAERYIDNNRLFDYRIITTIGISADEVEQIKKLNYIRDANGAVYADFIYNDEINDKKQVIRAHSITEDINGIEIVEGNMPSSGNECILDARYFSKDMIGENIKVSDENDNDTLNKFKYKEYKVVGTVKSSCYMNIERGTTTLCNGQIDGFMYIPEKGFDFEYYTECYVRINGEEDSFSKEYEHKIEKYTDIVTDDCRDIICLRYTDAVKEAQDDIVDAEDELVTKKEEELQKLQDAREELDNGWADLNSAKNKLYSSTQELKTNKETLEVSKNELLEKEKLLTATKIELDNAYSQIVEAQKKISEGEKELVNKKKLLDELGETLADYETQLSAKLFEIELHEVQLEESKKQLNELQILASAGDTTHDSEIDMLQDAIQTSESKITVSKTEYTNNKTYYDNKKSEYQNGQNEYTKGIAAIEASKTEFNTSQDKYSNGMVEYSDGLKQLETAKTELSEHEKELNDAQKKIASAQKEIKTNEKKLNDGENEYSTSYSDYETQIINAQKEIDKGKKELKKIEEPEYYVLDRYTNVGFACFESDADIVEGIAKVFPVFFFLIAALVCSTTMTRMIDDERTQIGTLRALGYSNFKIMLKYIMYSGSAAVIGCVGGYYAGVYAFPKTIWKAYGMLYGFTDLEFIVLPYLLIISIIVSLLCSVGTTYIACHSELRETSAELIRKKAPAAGKRILLERISFVWKRMKFLHKVSARNIFRFKKRMLMMIIGIAGCSALVLTGFGINDSISNIVNFQFGKIMKMDANITFSDGVTDDIIKKFETDFKSEIDDYALINQTSVEAKTETGTKNIYFVSSEDDNTTDFVDLHLGKKQVNYPNNGEVVLSEKIAKIMGANIGDEVTFLYGDNKEITFLVSGIFENYVYNYAFISVETYEDKLGEEYVPKTVYLNFKEECDEFEVTARLGKLEGISSVNVMSELKSRVDNSMKSLNYIVWLVIGCAGALAFIVLFNLSNINITERIREIATIRVLGFYQNETSAYVFRENIVLTIMGIIVGFPVGIWLHSFVMSEINIDMVTFQVTIMPFSYILSVIVVIGFTFFVELVMRRKLAKINMAEALKSNE